MPDCQEISLYKGYKVIIEKQIFSLYNRGIFFEYVPGGNFMNLAEIETFLTIVNTKSITRTADLLFLSQPTVSHRLNSLENELGFPLVIRNKGHKQV